MNTPHLCYIGDILNIVGAASCPEEELQCFIDHLTNFNSSIKYTYTISYNTVTFLDIQLTIDNNHIKSYVHIKPTDSHNYLLFSSSHPPSCKQSIPFSQLLSNVVALTMMMSLRSQIKSRITFLLANTPSKLLNQPTKIFNQITERIFLCHLLYRFLRIVFLNSSIPPFKLSVTSHHSEALQHSYD